MFTYLFMYIFWCVCMCVWAHFCIKASILMSNHRVTNDFASTKVASFFFISCQ